jgi:hypothetical protein
MQAWHRWHLPYDMVFDTELCPDAASGLPGGPQLQVDGYSWLSPAGLRDYVKLLSRLPHSQGEGHPQLRLQALLRHKATQSHLCSQPYTVSMTPCKTR